MNQAISMLFILFESWDSEMSQDVSPDACSAGHTPYDSIYIFSEIIMYLYAPTIVLQPDVVWKYTFMILFIIFRNYYL